MVFFMIRRNESKYGFIIQKEGLKIKYIFHFSHADPTFQRNKKSNCQLFSGVLRKNRTNKRTATIMAPVESEIILTGSQHKHSAIWMRHSNEKVILVPEITITTNATC
jgi:hypothetical protein